MSETRTFRVGFVPGVAPDRWARAWTDGTPRRPLDLVPLDEGMDPVALLRAGDLAMCFVRLPVDPEGLHLVRLYDEQPVVVVAREHPVAAYDRIDVGDLADERLLQDPAEVPAWRGVAPADVLRDDVPVRSRRQAVEGVAADEGVLVVPMSVARLHHRRDVVAVPVDGVPTSTVALAWLREADDDRSQAFVGVVRGRTAYSSRG